MYTPPDLFFENVIGVVHQQWNYKQCCVSIDNEQMKNSSARLGGPIVIFKKLVATSPASGQLRRSEASVDSGHVQVHYPRWLG